MTDFKLPEDGMMNALYLTEIAKDLSESVFTVKKVKIPEVGAGQILVKVAAAPINPSDYGSWAGAPQKVDRYLGKEGSGVVVAVGEGVPATMVGKKCGFTSTTGTYAEYAVTEAVGRFFPFPDDAPVADGCSFFVNPFTVCGILDTARQCGSTGLIHGAAASQLGQQMIKVAKDQKMTIINLVRRQEQADTIKALGAEHIIVTEEGWEKKLQAMAEELKINVAFDPIAGDMTGQLMSCLPKGGTVFVYGGLSKKPCSGISPLDLIYFEKKVVGWFLPKWIDGEFEKGGVDKTKRVMTAAQQVIPALFDGWAKSSFQDCKLEDAHSSLLGLFKDGFTNKKLRIVL